MVADEVARKFGALVADADRDGKKLPALREQMRATGYRRVLMSQLLNDERIKGYVAEILSDEKRLPGPENPPAPAEHQDDGH